MRRGASLLKAPNSSAAAGLGSGGRRGWDLLVLRTIGSTEACGRKPTLTETRHQYYDPKAGVWKLYHCVQPSIALTHPLKCSLLLSSM